MYYYINHTSQFKYNTGIQRCVRSIAKALIELDIPLRPVIWDLSINDFAIATADSLAHIELWNGPNKNDWCETNNHTSDITDQWLLIPEIISGPNEPSLKSILKASLKKQLRIAWVFHDALPIRRSEFYGLNSSKVSYYHKKYMEGLSCSELVFPNSLTSSQHLVHFLQSINCRYNHIFPLPLPIEFSGVRRHNPVREVNKKASLNFLCVSSLEPRKNHFALLKAIAYLHSINQFNAKLVIVGWPNTEYIVSGIRRAIDLGLPIEYIHDADDSLLNKFYDDCHFTIYPSIEEGFGLPVAESIWHHRPCICSNYGALGEFSKFGGIMVLDTSNWLEIANGISLLINDKRLQCRLHEEVKNIQVTTWKSYVQDILSIINNTSQNI